MCGTTVTACAKSVGAIVHRAKRIGPVQPTRVSEHRALYPNQGFDALPTRLAAACFLSISCEGGCIAICQAIAILSTLVTRLFEA